MTDGRPLRRITGYRRDDEDQWVAELECGHTQHVRHDPPWQVREWTQTAEGRAAHLGTTLPCASCDDRRTMSAPGGMTAAD